MPTYLGQPVSDDYLQGLIKAYRDAFKKYVPDYEDSDQPVIDRLAACGITKNLGADVVGQWDGQKQAGG